jgi:hypothetical protein
MTPAAVKPAVSVSALEALDVQWGDRAFSP